MERLITEDNYPTAWGTGGTSSYLRAEAPNYADYEMLMSKFDENIMHNEADIGTMYKEYAREVAKDRTPDESQYFDNEPPENSEKTRGLTNFKYHGSKTGNIEPSHPEITLFDLKPEHDPYNGPDLGEVRRRSARKWLSASFGEDNSEQQIHESVPFPGQLNIKFRRGIVEYLTKTLRIFSEPFEYSQKGTGTGHGIKNINNKGSGMSAINNYTLYNHDSPLAGPEFAEYYNQYPLNWQHAISNILLNRHKWTGRSVSDDMVYVAAFGKNRTGRAHSLAKKVNCRAPGQVETCSKDDNLFGAGQKAKPSTKANLGMAMSQIVEGMVDNAEMKASMAYGVENKHLRNKLGGPGALAGRDAGRMQKQVLIDPNSIKEALYGGLNSAPINKNAGKSGLKLAKPGKISESRESKFLDGDMATIASMKHALTNTGAYKVSKGAGPSTNLAPQHMKEGRVVDNLTQEIFKPRGKALNKNNHGKFEAPKREATNYLALVNANARAKFKGADKGRAKHNIKYRPVLDNTAHNKNLKQKQRTNANLAGRQVDSEIYGRENMQVKAVGGGCKKPPWSMKASKSTIGLEQGIAEY